jgi:endogenous inhibitor of DNA gyrase (YacG/DUF329 family)
LPQKFVSDFHTPPPLFFFCCERGCYIDFGAWGGGFSLVGGTIPLIRK